MAISVHCEGFGANCLAVAAAEIQGSSLMICHTTSCGAIFKDLQVVVVVVVVLVPEIFQCMLCHIFQQNLGTPLLPFLSGICGRRNRSQFHLLAQSKSIGCLESWDACQPLCRLSRTQLSQCTWGDGPPLPALKHCAGQKFWHHSHTSCQLTIHMLKHMNLLGLLI
jgi:hypothetical protein